MFKRLAFAGAFVALLALTPAAHADTGLKASASANAVVGRAPCLKTKVCPQPQPKRCGGLVALLMALGFNVETVDLGANVDAKASATVG